MKTLGTLILLISTPAVYAQTEQTDSIATKELQEVVVEPDASLETAKKTILYPTKIEKQHSTNGYQLVANMNMPELEVNPRSKQITTISGQTVVVLINGAEALPDELATLPAADIVSIDYQRNPGGKYAGQGAVMNFITRQHDYGGNVYLSAQQGFTHVNGNYLGMANYKRNALGLSVTASGEWDKVRGENREQNSFLFPEGTLYQANTPLSNREDKNSQYMRLKMSHAVNCHDFTAALSLNRKGTPSRTMIDNMEYRGLYDCDSEVRRSSNEKSLAPQLDLRYSLWLPHDQSITINFSSAFAHTRYHSIYSETDIEPIANDTRENYVSADLGVSYMKQLPRGITIGVNVAEWYKRYHDSYSGSFSSAQNLENNFVQVSAMYQQSLANGFYCYADLGVSNLVSRLSGITDNHWQPVAYYGANYAINQRHSLSFNGLFVHSIYDPSYKNDAVIQTSPFQANVGNPYLKPLKCLQNTLSYNGRVGHVRLSASLSNWNYFDNNVFRYYIEEGRVCKQLVNDGNFSGTKLALGVTYNLFDNKLSIGGNGLLGYLRLDSETRPVDKWLLRGSLNATLFLGDWSFKAVYAPQRKTMSWDGVHIIDPSQYGLTINWQRGNWALEGRVENFLKRYQGDKISANYGCYVTSGETLTNALGRNISISITYTLPYGKKTDKENPETQSKINSAILRPF